jgi:hypothetical protein
MLLFAQSAVIKRLLAAAQLRRYLVLEMAE